MLVNEGLVLYLIDKLEKKYDLKKKYRFIGNGFKVECDDTRSSLSYKLKKFLVSKAKNVLCTDPFVKTDNKLVKLNYLLSKSDILILCVPHKKYRNLKIKNKEIIDIWGFIKK